MEDKRIFGKFVAKKRKESQLTQKDLAEKLFVTESAITKWESGISYVVSRLVGWCSKLGANEGLRTDSLWHDYSAVCAYIYPKSI